MNINALFWIGRMLVTGDPVAVSKGKHLTGFAKGRDETANTGHVNPERSESHGAEGRNRTGNTMIFSHLLTG